MNNRILNYIKTEHFLYSQWDRKIDDQLLRRVLPYVKCSNCPKDVIIVQPSFLRKKGINAKNHECLVIIIRHNVLVTCYWCNHVDYLYTKEGHAHFQILTK